MNRAFLAAGREKIPTRWNLRRVDLPVTGAPAHQNASRRGLALLAAGAFACLGFVSPLVVSGDAAHAATEVRLMVTDGSDQATGDPAPGTLRAVLGEIAADSAQSAAGSSDYVVEFDPGVRSVVLAADIDIELGAGANSLAVRGGAAERVTIDVGGFGASIAGEELPGAVEYSNLELSGDGGWSGPVAREHILSGVTPTDLWYFPVESRERDTLENVTAANTEIVTAESAAEDVDYSLEVTGSTFTASKLSVNPSPALSSNVSIKSTTMTGSVEGPALHVYAESGQGHGPANLSISDGTRIVDNPQGGCHRSDHEHGEHFRQLLLSQRLRGCAPPGDGRGGRELGCGHRLGVRGQPE